MGIFDKDWLDELFELPTDPDDIVDPGHPYNMSEDEREESERKKRERNGYYEDVYDDDDFDEDDGEEIKDDDEDVVYVSSAAERDRLIAEKSLQVLIDYIQKANESDAKEFYWDSYDEDEQHEDLKKSLGQQGYQELLAAVETRFYGNKPYLKYHDGAARWKYNEPLFIALLDTFPELRENYDEETEIVIDDFFAEMYEINRSKAIRYFEWLQSAFPIAELKKLKTETADSMAHEISTGILSRLFDLAIVLEDNFLSVYLKKHPHFNFAFFGAMPWAKHNLINLTRYVDYFEEFGDYTAMNEGYELYLKHQVGNYTDRDLGQFWDGQILDYGHSIPDKLYNYYAKVLDDLGEYGNMGRRRLKGRKKEHNMGD
jgi:hypothetical protein